jgi:hypothetical protein
MATQHLKIVFFAYAFPPFNYAGAHRLRHFVRFLTESGWECAIVTIKETYAGPKDPSLVASLPAGIRICRTPTFDAFELQNRFLGVLQPNRTKTSTTTIRGTSWWLAGLGVLYRFFVRFFFFPDESMAWRWLAYRQALSFAEDFQPDVVFSSSLPNTSHLLALRIATKLHVPLAVDFRDEWTQNEYRPPLTPLHALLHRCAERHVLERAELVTATTEPMTRQLKSAAPLSSARFETVFNGFDDTGISGTNSPTNTFRIVHTGNFYGQRTPDPFFRALINVIREKRVDPSRLEIIFAGSSSFPMDAYDKDESALLERCVQMMGYIKQSDALALQQSATILLLIQDGTHLASKLFEYLRTGRPILAITPSRGQTAEILRHINGLPTVGPDDPRRIADILSDAFLEWEKNHIVPIQYNNSVVRTFSRREQTLALDHFLRSIVHRS